MGQRYIIYVQGFEPRCYVSVRYNRIYLSICEGCAYTFIKDDLTDPPLTEFLSDKQYELIPVELCKRKNGKISYEREEYRGFYRIMHY